MKRVKVEKPYIDLMLDSGVFSAWNRGEQLDIYEYIDYVKEHQSLFSSIVNMDVIPGEFGKKRTMEQVEDSASGSYRNQQIMKDAGLSPIPVFHQGENFSWLEKLLEDGEQYIGISSAKDLWARDQRVWLDQVFSLLTDSKGRPCVKTHGFGITRAPFLFRYPWYTVDSTTWLLSAGYGKIFCPVYVDGKPDYLRPHNPIIMSGVEQKNSSSQKQQYEALGPQLQNCVSRFLKEEVGASVTEARNGAEVRRRAILTYYMRVADALKDVRFKHGYGSANIKKQKKYKLHPLSKSWRMRIMFATSFNKQFSKILTDANATTRLLSYYEVRNHSDELLHEYVTTGMVGKYEPRVPKQNWDNESYLSFRKLRLFSRLEEYDAEESTT